MPSEKSLKRMDKLVESFTEKSGTTTHPDRGVTDAVVQGLAEHLDEKGQPITEYLPDNHDGRQIYGIVADPTPDQGRALRHKAAEREKERQERPS